MFQRMKVLVTGAGGFIGTELTRALLKAGVLRDTSGNSRTIERILVADVHLPNGNDGRLVRVQKDITDASLQRDIAEWKPDTVFHLAAVLTSAAEREPARALAVNVSALAALIESVARQSQPPRFIFASSIAVFGGKLPNIVDDDLAQHPQTSYGTHKSIAELVLADATRHGLIDGRALRLPIVLVHPGPPTQAVSDRLAAIVRDAAAGKNPVSPLAATTRVPVVSVQTVVRNLIALHDADKATLGGSIAFNQPALTVSMNEIVAATRKAVPGASNLDFSFNADPALETIVASWPKGFVSARADKLGIKPDASFEDIVTHYMKNIAHD
jgi:nucleoside-diphosphate-sugar epimerase